MGQYYILTLKNRSTGPSDCLLWYRANASGYTWYLSSAGKYDVHEAKKHADDKETFAIRCEDADALAQPVVPNECLNCEKLVNLARRKSLPSHATGAVKEE